MFQTLLLIVTPTERIICYPQLLCKSEVEADATTIHLNHLLNRYVFPAGYKVSFFTSEKKNVERGNHVSLSNADYGTVSS